MDTETTAPIATEVVRYRLRVALLGIPARAMLKTPVAPALLGSAPFGHPDVSHVLRPGVSGEATAAIGG